MKPLASSKRRQDRGVVIIWTAFFLMFMLGFVALGIDVAKLMATRTQLQNAADAAALAGASSLEFETGNIYQDSAVIRAQHTASFNKAFTKSSTAVSLNAADVSFPELDRCKVIVRRDPANGGSVVTHIAQVLGIKELEMSATATAEASAASAVCEGLIPMAPIVPVGSTWFDPSCSQTFNLKVDAGSGTSGNYQLLQYPDCYEGSCGEVMGGGGAAVRCQTENGYSCCVEIGDEFVVTQPGNKVGPFREGILNRWDADTDRRENICYTEYRGNGNRVVRVPIVETFDVSGKKVVRIISFSAFFIQRRPSGQAELWGQFVFDIGPGEPGNAGPGTLYTLHLVE